MSPDRWQAIWSRRGVAAWLLRPGAFLLSVLGALRRRLYALGLLKAHRLPVPVIVVGNVVVGGAGKTPTVIALIEHLKTAGWHPGVVSRGYGRTGQEVLAVEDNTPAAAGGDEPALIRRRTRVPVYVAPRRVEAAQALLKAYPEVNLILCDDGLQHLALGRDLSVAVFDERGTGNGWLLPAGLLREPWPPAPSNPFRPDLLLLQRRPDGPVVRLPPSDVPAFEAFRRLGGFAFGPDGQHTPLSALAHTPLIAVAGIARPPAFFDMLRQQGLHIVREVPLADHAASAEYAALSLQPDDSVICTEKDAVKLFPLLPKGVVAWTIPLELTPEPAFWSAFDTLLARLDTRP